MADRLRELLDLVLDSLDEPGADGRALAQQASFSRDHLDRLLAGATGETPVALRRRLLLERAAWQLRHATATPSAAAGAAGYGSLEAFSRAFSRAYGLPPSSFAEATSSVELEAPNGIHFHPPAGLLVPGTPGPAVGGDLTERMVLHHVDRVHELLTVAAALPVEQLARPLRPGFVAVGLEGEEPSAALMAERLVRTVEVWVAAIVGEPAPGVDLAVPAAGAAGASGAAPGDRDASDAGASPEDGGAPVLGGDVSELLPRFDRASRAFVRVARSIRDRGAWDEAFVDALCEPPQSFTYGGVLSHVLAYGAIRREMLASVLTELGGDVPDTADPILWEQQRARERARERARGRADGGG